MNFGAFPTEKSSGDELCGLCRTLSLNQKLLEGNIRIINEAGGWHWNTHWCAVSSHRGQSISERNTHYEVDIAVQSIIRLSGGRVLERAVGE